MPSQLKELFSSSSEETTLCKKHKIAPECYCLDCKLWICSECKKTFHDDLFTSHKICKEEPKKEKECKVHQNEKIIKYCNECKKELCAQCEKEDEKHSSNIVDIKEKENEIKKEIKNKMVSRFPRVSLFLCGILGACFTVYHLTVKHWGAIEFNSFKLLSTINILFLFVYS